MKKFNLLSLVGTIIFLQTSIAQINLAHAESPLHDKVLEAIDDPSAKSLSKLQQASVIAAIRQAGVGDHRCASNCNHWQSLNAEKLIPKKP
jgi:hypothetical protein